MELPVDWEYRRSNIIRPISSGSSSGKMYYYYLLWDFFCGLLYMNWFRKSRLGFQLRSIKDNEEVARSLGIDVHWAKIKTYAVATAFVSVIGSFHACYIKNIEPEDTMSLDISVLIALMAMLGGAGSYGGRSSGGHLIPMKSYLKNGWGPRPGRDRADHLQRHHHWPWPPLNPGGSGESWKRSGSRKGNVYESS